MKFQTTPTKFLTLSSEICTPFVIPNVSPVSSPIMKPISSTIPVDDSFGGVIQLS